MPAGRGAVVRPFRRQDNLLRCGATLAAHSWRVGDQCRAVLRKYGQL
jgi:hypothetical protein